MISKQHIHPILFVGAGPGDPELITVKGQKALQMADVIVYAGSLVPQELLNWSSSKTEYYNSATMDLNEIMNIMVKANQNGKRVVRLHTGDPSLYGAIFEQMSVLKKHGIEYQIIPGVTAAFAAAASLKIEYTIPELNQTLILTRMAGRTPVPELENLESLAKHQSSMAIYLSMSLIDQIGPILTKAYGEKAICAVVYKASYPDEQIHYMPVNQLPQKVKALNIKKHALVIVGNALKQQPSTENLRSKLYDNHFSHEYRKPSHA
jgi:precorrin-4/cobalt-precorrin-4 C11-methyltransferase